MRGIVLSAAPACDAVPQWDWCCRERGVQYIPAPAVRAANECCDVTAKIVHLAASWSTSEQPAQWSTKAALT